MLKDGWLGLAEEEKDTFRAWTEWDKKRYARDLAVFQSRRDGHADAAAAPAKDDGMKEIHVPKKRKKQQQQAGGGSSAAIPKKKKKKA